MSKTGQASADAEAAMMGFTVSIESPEQLAYITAYILRTLTGTDFRAEEVLTNAMEKYNSSKDKSIKWITVSSSPFGRMITFVRDKSKLTKKDGSPTLSGSLAWVENIDAPDCSELGYVFFQNVNGKTKRVA